MTMNAGASEKNRWRLLLLAGACILLLPAVVTFVQENHGRQGRPALKALLDPSPYPIGTWRVMTWEQLGRVALWPSHILIRHREIVSPRVSFSLAKWDNPAELSGRSRDEARFLAESLAKALQANPTQFPSYVQRYSDDLATRDFGGSLGSISAQQLRPWHVVLDALEVVRPGGVSKVIETEFGFHVFLQRNTPAPEMVSGSRLVIGYDEVQWLRLVGRTQVPEQRSRAEAFALAQRLSALGKQKPEDFTALVREHSEHRDAIYGGDLGAWSSREPSKFPREVEVLQQLPIGGVSQPIDSLVGFEVLQRTAPRPRTRYAMLALRLFFDPNAADHRPNSRAVKLQLAQAALKDIRQNPDSFDQLRKDHCCKEFYRFEEGPEFPEVAQALSALEFGEITESAAESINEFIIARRVDPSKLPLTSDVPLTLNFTGPVDSAYWFGAFNPATARMRLKQLTGQAIGVLGLSPAEVTHIRALHDEPWPDSYDHDRKERRYVALKRGQAQLREFLGGAVYARYRKLVDRHVMDWVLSDQSKGDQKRTLVQVGER